MSKLKVYVKNNQNAVKIPVGIRLLIRRCCQAVLASEGFTGISVALLGLSHPIGVLFSGLFIAYLTAGGFYLQLFEFSTEIIDIIVAVIIYFSAFALIVKTILTRMNHKREKGGGRT